jgi:hypothetical protein
MNEFFKLGLELVPGTDDDDVISYMTGINIFKFQNNLLYSFFLSFLKVLLKIVNALTENICSSSSSKCSRGRFKTVNANKN